MRAGLLGEDFLGITSIPVGDEHRVSQNGIVVQHRKDFVPFFLHMPGDGRKLDQ